MSGLLTAGIAKMVYGATKAIMLDAVLTRSAAFDGADPWEPGATRTPLTNSCKGFVDDYSESRIDGTVIMRGDRRIVLIAYGMTLTPQPGDQVTIQGEYYKIINVRRDPASAAFTLQVRR